jgi:hypothetical protein
VRRSALLALEPGRIQLETARHHKFRAARVDGDGLGVEHYWPTPQLLEHINDLRTASGLPELRIGLRPVLDTPSRVPRL